MNPKNEPLLLASYEAEPGIRSDVDPIVALLQSVPAPMAVAA